MTQPPRMTLPPELDPRGPLRRRQPAPDVRPYRRSRRRRIARALSWFAVVLSALTLFVSVAGYAAFTYYNGKIPHINIHLGGGPSAAADGAAQNFLLVGSDTRAFKGGQAFQAPKGSPAYVTGQRSDTVILAHVPAGNAKATLISFPRDSWIEIPAYRDQQGNEHQAHMGKLNSAFALGGPVLLVQVMQNLTGMRVDHYVQVDFAGFQQMVNSLGGVDICVRTTRHDHDSGDYLTAGTHHVNGAQALAFVRDRKGLPQGDIDRIKDQQVFMSQMLKKVTAAGTLANPFKMNAFLQSLTSSVTVDQGFGFSEMRTLALRFRHLDPAHVTFETIPITTDNGYRAGQSVVLIDQQKADALFASLRNQGKKSQSTSSPPPKVTVPPSQVTLQVENGSGRQGLARQTADQLRAQGFTVTSVGNAPGGQNTVTSVVRYGAGQADSARTVAAAIPGATLRQDDSLGNSIVLVLGSNFSQVRQVGGGTSGGAGGASSAPSSQAPSSTPPTQTAANTSCAP